MRRRHWLAMFVAVCFIAGCSKQTPTVDASDGTVVTPYLAIGDTLAHDRTDGLEALRTLVVEACRARAGQPGIDAILDGAARIGPGEIAAARAAFERMSTGMIAYLQSEPDQQAGRMIVHCTMTFSGQGGTWVQAEGKIMNPYEGATMLHCGDKIPWSRMSR
jgi:hypothetical protein